MGFFHEGIHSLLIILLSCNIAFSCSAHLSTLLGQLLLSRVSDNVNKYIFILRDEDEDFKRWQIQPAILLVLKAKASSSYLLDADGHGAYEYAISSLGYPLYSVYVYLKIFLVLILKSHGRKCTPHTLSEENFYTLWSETSKNFHKNYFSSFKEKKVNQVLPRGCFSFRSGHQDVPHIHALLGDVRTRIEWEEIVSEVKCSN